MTSTQKNSPGYESDSRPLDEWRGHGVAFDLDLVGRGTHARLHCGPPSRNTHKRIDPLPGVVDHARRDVGAHHHALELAAHS